MLRKEGLLLAKDIREGLLEEVVLALDLKIKARGEHSKKKYSHGIVRKLGSSEIPSQESNAE